jgi:hypothetical protein
MAPGGACLEKLMMSWWAQAALPLPISWMPMDRTVVQKHMVYVHPHVASGSILGYPVRR